MTSEWVFQLMQGILFVGFILHRAYYTQKYPPDEQATLEEQQKGIPEQLANLLALPALIGILLYIFYPRWMAWSAFPLPDWTRWLGVGIALVGFILLQASHNALGKNWSDQPRITESQSFVTNGPYSRIRHPIYTAFLMILGSSLLISANWFIGGLWILMTAADIRSRIRFEEEKLLARFGEDYLAHRKKTGALLPKLW
jgi:protein-S-isoprenylcysteine O-methyltransferase Ste14